ncbi:MAG: hypothetical protein ACOVO1_12855 [Chitinophagaceae bacterium]
MRKNLITQTTIFVAVLLGSISIISCNNGTPSDCTIDTLAIVKAYNSKHPFYPRKSNFKVSNGLSPQTFFPNNGNDIAKQNLEWAKRSIEMFQAENTMLITDNSEKLEAYFISKEDIDSLLKSDPKTTGIRLYFGKSDSTYVDNLKKYEPKSDKVAGMYTHFIFPTVKAKNASGETIDDNVVNKGFIEQIKPSPCPSSQPCPTSESIIDKLNAAIAEITTKGLPIK